MSLLNKSCVRTNADTPKLQKADIQKLLKEIPGWTVSHETEIPH